MSLYDTENTERNETAGDRWGEEERIEEKITEAIETQDTVEHVQKHKQGTGTL